MSYEYHFGEGWKLEVRVEKTAASSKDVRYPLCVGGERAGPPEDCGGLEAYHDMLSCLKDPNSDLGKEWTAWLGCEYNPVVCDLDKVNAALRKLGK